jgi:hypothetical protein
LKYDFEQRMGEIYKQQNVVKFKGRVEYFLASSMFKKVIEVS